MHKIIISGMPSDFYRPENVFISGTGENPQLSDFLLMPGNYLHPSEKSITFLTGFNIY